MVTTRKVIPIASAAKKVATKQTVKPPTSWSFSRYSDYRQCPLKFKLKHLLKIQEPGNDAMQRGAKIHDDAEAYLKGKLAKLPAELAKFGPEFKRLKAVYKKKTSGMIVEDTWAFTNNWTPTMWDDWINCWVRIKLDCAEIVDHELMVITDWKTGKFRPEKNAEYIEQLELYALAALLLHEHIDEVYPRLAYVDEGTIYPSEDEATIYTREDIPMLIKTWAKRVKPMMSDKIFAPRPNNLCRWCFYRNSNAEAGGGQCKY